MLEQKRSKVVAHVINQNVKPRRSNNLAIQVTNHRVVN
jgi:hypothetical protein